MSELVDSSDHIPIDVRPMEGVREDILPKTSSIETSTSSSTTIKTSLNGNSKIYIDSAVVWVRLGQSWWPGTVVSLDRCPADFVADLKKTPIAVVKFFNESGIFDIHKHEHIYHYNCDRKKEFIKKGIRFHEKMLEHFRTNSSDKNNLKSVQSKEELFKKFESDVLMAEKLTAGPPDIFALIEEESNKRRIDYSNLGFGAPKPKKKKDDSPKKIGSDITEAVRYKKEKQDNGARVMKLEHKSVIMEQPIIEDMSEDLKKACNSYTCYVCGFSCTRLGVIVWHNKSHLKTVLNYDTGIKRKKIKARPYKNIRKKKRAVNNVDHSATNGHVEGGENNADKTKQLLDDWEDEGDIDGEDAADNENLVNSGEAGSGAENNGNEVVSGEDLSKVPKSNRGQPKIPMRRAVDLNSAFDALLATTPTTSTNGSSDNQVTPSKYTYTNNDSDSDANSDWEKYYNRDSDEDDFENGDTIENEEDTENDDTIENEEEDPENDDTVEKEEENIENCDTVEKEEDVENGDTVESLGEDIENSDSIGKEEESEGEEISSSTNANNGDESNGVGEISEDNNTDEEEQQVDNEESSSNSSSPSNTAGPAYMLVAVDAHGNNVPMPALTDRNHSSNLVAVEASMEDGTSRTLYIDPAYLEPNVDLSNLMLHIDNSGQETVIIPSSSSQETEVSEATTTTILSNTNNSTSLSASATSNNTDSSSEATTLPPPVQHSTSTADSDYAVSQEESGDKVDETDDGSTIKEVETEGQEHTEEMMETDSTR